MPKLTKSNLFPQQQAPAINDPPPQFAISDLLSSADVERVFGRSDRTLRRWETLGHLTPVRVGNAKFYRAEDIQRMISGRLEEAVLTRAGALPSHRRDPP